MTITVNKDQKTVDDGLMLHELLNQLDMGLNTVAVWINGRQLMYEEYGHTALQDGDNVRIYYICIGG